MILNFLTLYLQNFQVYSENSSRRKCSRPIMDYSRASRDVDDGKSRPEEPAGNLQLWVTVFSFWGRWTVQAATIRKITLKECGHRIDLQLKSK